MGFFKTSAFAAAIAFLAGSASAVPVPPPGAVAIDHSLLCTQCNYGSYQDFALVIDESDAKGFGQFLFWVESLEFGFGEDPEEMGYFPKVYEHALSKADLFYVPAGQSLGYGQLDEGVFLFHFALSDDGPGNEIVASALYGIAAVPLPASAFFLLLGLAGLAGVRRRA